MKWENFAFFVCRFWASSACAKYCVAMLIHKMAQLEKRLSLSVDHSEMCFILHWFVNFHPIVPIAPIRWNWWIGKRNKFDGRHMNYFSFICCRLSYCFSFVLFFLHQNLLFFFAWSFHSFHFIHSFCRHSDVCLCAFHSTINGLAWLFVHSKDCNRFNLKR